MYKYFNPHPKGLSTEDCVKRAIVVVTGRDYMTVGRELNNYKKISGAKSFNSVKNLRYAEDVLNAKKISLDEKITADEFCKKNPKGRYILDMDEHWSACVDGCIYDTWDSGKEKVNFAYEITTEPYTEPDLRKQVFKNCCTSEKISDTETRIRIYDGNGTFVTRKIPTELTAGYVLRLQHSNYQYIDLDENKKMKVEIYSREAIKKLMKGEFPKNTAVISFCSPRKAHRAEKERVHYGSVCDRVFSILIPDIDIEILGDYGYTYETYLAEADELAKFIYEAKAEGRDIICQCDYGQSRSAACAAAILQHFERRGIDIFSDYRYYPNQLVYHKVFDALERIKKAK